MTLGSTEEKGKGPLLPLPQACQADATVQSLGVTPALSAVNRFAVAHSHGTILGETKVQQELDSQ